MNATLTRAPTVVLVDDDQALLRALRFDLELDGFSVETHRSAVTIRPQDLPYDDACMVIDYHLPGRSGLELLKGLRDCGVELPAIVITTNPGRAMKKAVAALGASLVEKPLLGPDLVSEIRSLLASAPAESQRN